jgi:hypothetical protein
MKEIALTFSWLIAVVIILRLGSCRIAQKEEQGIADIHSSQKKDHSNEINLENHYSKNKPLVHRSSVSFCFHGKRGGIRCHDKMTVSPNRQ